MDESQKNILPRQCRECGVTFPGGPRAWYCPACRAERQREASRLSKRRAKRGVGIKLGDSAFCVVCRKEYVIRSAQQKYCPECAPEAIRRVDATQGLEYYHAHKEEINPPRNAKRREEREKKPKTAICFVCGKEFVTRQGPAKSCPECRDEFKRQSQAVADYRRYPRRKLTGITLDQEGG